MLSTLMLPQRLDKNGHKITMLARKRNPLMPGSNVRPQVGPVGRGKVTLITLMHYALVDGLFVILQVG